MTLVKFLRIEKFRIQVSLFFSGWFLSDLLGSKTFFSNFQDFWLVPLEPYIKVFFLYLFLSDRSVFDTIQLEDRFLCFLFRPSKIQDGRHFLTKINKTVITQLHLVDLSLWACSLESHWGGGGVLPYMGHIGMCRCEGYGFQAVYSSIGYINQSDHFSRNRPVG